MTSLLLGPRYRGEVRLEGILPVSPIHEDDELNAARASTLKDCVERGPRRPACEDHIVNEDHVPIRHIHVVGRPPGRL
nr:hypothetical protein [Salinibacter altiplanensis]